MTDGIMARNVVGRGLLARALPMRYPVKEGKRPNLRSTTASEFTTANYSLGNTFISTTAVKYITNSIVIHDRSFYIS